MGCGRRWPPMTRCVQKAVRWSQKLADALAGGEPGAVVAVATDDELACEDVRSGEDVEKLSVLELWRLQFIADLPADVRAAMVRALAAVSPKVTTYPISDGHSWRAHRRRAVRRFGRGPRRRRLVTGRSSPCRTCAGSPPPPRGGAGSTCAVTPTPFPTITARPGGVCLTALSRIRERAMKRFASPGQAQRFLFAFSHIRQHFRPRRHLISAPQWRTEMTNRFAVWDEITVAAAA